MRNRAVCVALLLFVSTATAGEEATELTVIFTPRRRAVLAAEVTARAVARHVEFGQVFAKDAPLLDLDDRRYRQHLRKAEALESEARTTLSLTEKLHASGVEVERAQALLTAAEKTRALTRELVEKKVSENRARAVLAAAEKNLEAMRDLAAGDAATELELANAERDVQVARAELAQAEAAARMSLVRAEKDYAVADAERRRIEMTAELELQEARKTLAVAESNTAFARLELEGCAISAPYDGRVVEVLVQAQEWVQRGQPLIEIVDDKVLRAEVLVPSKVYSRVKLGLRVPIRVIELDREVTGTVSNIAANLDPASKTFRIYAEVDNAARELKGGMNGVIRLRDLVNQP